MTQRTALLGPKSSKQDFKDFRGMFEITVMSWKPVEITCTSFTNVFCIPYQSALRSTDEMAKLIDALCSLFWGIIWLIILLLIALPVGFIAAILYILVSPFNACCDCTKSLTDFFKKGIEFPYNAASNAVNSKRGC